MDPSHVKSKLASRTVEEKPVNFKKGFASYAEEFKEPPVAMSPKKTNVKLHAAPIAAAQNNSRAKFLESLGIDNMDDPDATPAWRASQETINPRNATGSHDKTSARRQSSFDSSESQEGPGSFKPTVKPDITLGHPKRMSFGDTCPETDGLCVEDIKNMGNKCFEEGDYRKAIRLYTKAIERDGSNSAFYSNRSACYLQAAKQMGIDTRVMALRDADKAVELRPDWFKGYSRRGDALFKLERYAEAAEAYERGLALEPENLNLMHSLGEARNAAGQIKSSSVGSWGTVPQQPESLKSASHRSASELLDDLKRNIRSDGNSVLLGNDYKAAELAKFRSHRSTDSSRSASASLPSPECDVSSPVHERSAPKLDKSKIEPQFSSQAAAAYQQSLLEQYRKKKASSQTAFAPHF
jgi:tetratricopeptide (TPR) repeat protein